MPLFKLDDLTPENQENENPNHSDAVDFQMDDDVLFFRRPDILKKKITGIKQNRNIHYVSAGEWSCHELLFHLLSFTGPAKVWIATWTITEDPVRMLIDGLKSGIIQELNCILESRVVKRTPEAYQMAKHSMSNVRLSVCHAKVTVIENDEWSIAIVGSANYTNNPRIEAGVICTNKDVAEFHKNWISLELQNAHAFE